MAPNLLPNSGLMPPETTETRHDQRLLRYALAFGILIALICLGYFEENWRGRHAWAKTKHQLEARGAAIDWTNYIPATVPDDENFFAAPKMQRWFVGRGGNDLSSRLSAARSGFLATHPGDAVARVTVVNRGAKFAPEDADVILQYDSGLGTLALPPEGSSQPAGPAPEIVPLIVLDEVPLDNAIKAIAQQAGINYMLTPGLRIPSFGKLPNVTVRWTQITCRQALGTLLKAYHLQLIPDSKMGIARITVRDSAGPNIYSEPAAAARLQELMETAIAAATNDFQGQNARTAVGLTLVPGRLNHVKPVRVVVFADNLPGTNDVTEFFPVLTNAICPWITSRAQVEAIGSNTFDVRLNPTCYVDPAEYLTWSNTFANDFDLIREALKRPFMQMNGDYRTPFTQPIPNFVCMRLLAQTLADRTKCHLLLGDPDEALRDLTLLREMCRVLEGHPTTLVATMIDSSVTALYTEAIAEGLRLQAWRESQLAAIEKQLSRINLLPLLTDSLAMERAGQCHFLETASLDEFEKMFSLNPTTNFWKKMEDPIYLALRFGPRGWVYQNMSKIALLQQGVLESLDLTNRQVLVGQTDAATRDILAVNRFSPNSFLANLMLPNYCRAVQTLARNQCEADEARVACALERHRLARRCYPQTLGSLVPEFIGTIPTDIINSQPLKYRLEGAQFVLYSVGWNEIDDGGIPGPDNDGEADLRKGDWVWHSAGP
jgi:hypothetical protein